MSEKFSTSVDNTASPAEAWGAPTSEEGSYEDYIASRPEAESEEDKARLAEREAEMADRQPVAAKFENGSLVGETTYDDLSLKELAQFAGDAQNNFNDKSTSLEAQEHIQNRLFAAVEEGKITEDAAMQHIEQLDKLINPTVKVADDEVLVVGAPVETQPPTETEASKELYKDASTMDLVEKAMKARAEDGDISTANEILDTLKKRYAEKVANKELSQEAADIEYGKFESMINSAPLRDTDAAEKPKEAKAEDSSKEADKPAPAEKAKDEAADDEEDVIEVSDADRKRHVARTEELDEVVERKSKKRRMRKLGSFAAKAIRRPKASFAKAKQASKGAVDRAYAWSNRNFAGAEAAKATNEKESEEEKQAA